MPQTAWIPGTLYGNRIELNTYCLYTVNFIVNFYEFSYLSDICFKVKRDMTMCVCKKHCILHATNDVKHWTFTVNVASPNTVDPYLLSQFFFYFRFCFFFDLFYLSVKIVFCSRFNRFNCILAAITNDVDHRFYMLLQSMTLNEQYFGQQSFELFKKKNVKALPFKRSYKMSFDW